MSFDQRSYKFVNGYSISLLETAVFIFLLQIIQQAFFFEQGLPPAVLHWFIKKSRRNLADLFGTTVQGEISAQRRVTPVNREHVGQFAKVADIG